jgi:nicotinate-nucleotide pyrophosphorylase (carboxylating)
MSPQQLAQAVALRDGAGYPAKLEASGGVNLDTIRAIAASGVDYISVGRLTMSAPVVDIGLDWPT